MWRIKRFILGPIYIFLGETMFKYLDVNNHILEKKFLIFIKNIFNLSFETSDLFAMFIMCFIYALTLCIFIGGLYYIFTAMRKEELGEERHGLWHNIFAFLYVPFTFDFVRHPEKYNNPSSKSNINNIQDAINYRNGVLGTMTGDAALHEYAKTAWVDSMAANSNSSGGNTRDAISYANSRLASMSPKEGYEFLKR